MNNDDDPRTDEHHDDTPSLRQRLHAATGDRDAEAHALQDASDDEVNERDAKIAVPRSRGERGADEPVLDHDIATPEDAAAIATRHRTSARADDSEGA